MRSAQPCPKSGPRNRTGLAAFTAVALAATVLPMVLNAGSASAETAASFSYGGNAYGSTATLGTLINSGHVADLPLCTRTVPTSSSNSYGAVHLGLLGDIGAVSTHTGSQQSGSTLSSQTTTQTAGFSLAGGLVQATAVSNVATTSFDGTRYYRTASTTLAGLRIGGLAMPVLPLPNTKIAVPGVGSVTLNAQSTSTMYGARYITVNAVVLRVSATNLIGMPAGKVIIGYAQSSMGMPVLHIEDGLAYGTDVTLGTMVDSGRTAAAYMPCGGSGGGTRTVTTAALSVPGVLSTGAVTSTAASTDSGSSSSSATTNEMASVNLLGGLITADAVNTHSTTTLTDGVFTRSSAGTTIANLTVLGQPVTVAANAHIDIAGVGGLDIEKVVNTKTGVHVYGLQLTLSVAHGTLGVGTVVTVGSANSSVTG